MVWLYLATAQNEETVYSNNGVNVPTGNEGIMSSSELSSTAILLPTARVTFFSRDSQILTAARDVAQDWRFARVSVEVVEGDIYTAIDSYADVGSPDLLIIQTEAINEQLPIDLERLAGQCNEGTAAIIIGPDNDVNLYRKLIDMGISDYLVRPLETHVLCEVIAKTLIAKLGVSGSRLLAFMGAQGGVGASTVAQNAAVMLADEMKQKVLFVDLSGGWSSAGVVFGYEATTTLAEATRAAQNDNQEGLARMMSQVSDRLSVLASGGEVLLEPCVNSEGLETLLDYLMQTYPVVVVDASHAAPDLCKTMVYRANGLFVVSSPSLPSLRAARSLLHEIKEVRGGEMDEVSFLINRAGMDKGLEPKKADIEAAVEFPVSASIAYNPKSFLKAEVDGKPVVQMPDGESVIKTSLRSLLQKYMAQNDSGAGGNDDNAGLIGSLLSRFKK